MRRTQPREDLLSTFLASGTESLRPPSGGLGQWFLTAHPAVLRGCLCSHTVPIPGVRLGLSKTSDPGFKLVTCRTRMCLFSCLLSFPPCQLVTDFCVQTWCGEEKQKERRMTKAGRQKVFVQQALPASCLGSVRGLDVLLIQSVRVWCFERPKLKTSGFGVRKGLFIEKAPPRRWETWWCLRSIMLAGQGEGFLRA